MQKRTLFRLLSPVYFSLIVNFSFAQHEKTVLSHYESFFTGLTEKAGRSKAVEIPIDADHQYPIQITSKGRKLMHGHISGRAGSMLRLKLDKAKVSGFLITSVKDNEAYRYSTNEAGMVEVEEVDVNELLCVDYQGNQLEQGSIGQQPKRLEISEAWNPFDLESFPESNKVIFIDMDGYQLPSGTPWNNGIGLNCSAPDFTDIERLVVWTIVAEDYSPFRVNVTTKQSVYDAADPYARMKVIVTPTSYWSQGGGVALVSSFHWGEDLPCWVFSDKLNGVLSCGEAAAHEAGHTLDLHHDGQGSTEYYAGHRNWAPIMGNSYRSDLTQWSKGDYAGASNTGQDDIKIISGYLGYRNDDHGNTPQSATELFYTISDDGIAEVEAKNNKGVIERRTDQDVFHFYLAGGQIDLAVNPRGNPRPDLDLEVSLLDAEGNVLGVYSNNHTDFLAEVGVSRVLAGGDYYLVVDGVGTGDPSSGWTDYGSLGQYSIFGAIQGIAQKDYDIALGGILGIEEKACGSYLQPQIEVINGGKIEVQSFQVELRINGQFLEQRLVHSTIPSGESVTIDLGQIPVIDAERFSIYLSQPNGQNDEIEVNNDGEIEFELGPGQLLEFMISKGSMDPVMNWDISAGSITEQTSQANPQELDGEMLVQQFCVTDNDCYNFELSDAFLLDLCSLYPTWNSGTIYNVGDQMVYNGIIYEAATQIWAADPITYGHYYNEIGPCPTPSSTDYFTLKNLSTEELLASATVAQYASPYTVEFCLDVLTGQEEEKTEHITFFPNPANKVLHFSERVDHFILRNVHGQQLMELNDIDVLRIPEYLQTGLYVLEFTCHGEFHREKIYKE